MSYIATDIVGDPVEVIAEDGEVEVIEQNASDPETEFFTRYTPDQAIRLATCLLQAATEARDQE